MARTPDPNPLLKALADSYGSLAIVIGLAHIADEKAKACRPTHPHQADAWKNEAIALANCAMAILDGRPAVTLTALTDG
jgi:hypothetical protein